MHLLQYNNESQEKNIDAKIKGNFQAFNWKSQKSWADITERGIWIDWKKKILPKFCFVFFYHPFTSNPFVKFQHLMSSMLQLCTSRYTDSGLWIPAYLLRKKKTDDNPQPSGNFVSTSSLFNEWFACDSLKIPVLRFEITAILHVYVFYWLFNSR